MKEEEEQEMKRIEDEMELQEENPDTLVKRNGILTEDEEMKQIDAEMEDTEEEKEEEPKNGQEKEKKESSSSEESSSSSSSSSDEEEEEESEKEKEKEEKKETEILPSRTRRSNRVNYADIDLFEVEEESTEEEEESEEEEEKSEDEKEQKKDKPEPKAPAKRPGRPAKMNGTKKSKVEEESEDNGDSEEEEEEGDDNEEEEEEEEEILNLGDRKLRRRKGNPLKELKEQECLIRRRLTKIIKKTKTDQTSEEKTLLKKYPKLLKIVQKSAKKRKEAIDRLKEVEDPAEVLAKKCSKLAEAIRKCNHLVVYSGAGISTAANIPDYRGPNGVWTLMDQGKEVGACNLEKATPTYTHMSLFTLYKKGKLKHIVSQNCDGLHMRSGIPR